MTDRDIEARLKAAVEHTAPDGLARLLSDIDCGKGAAKMTRTNRRRSRWLGLAAACLALVLIAGGGGMYYHQNVAVATVVSLDVNPSIELNVNRAEKVIDCRGLNDEGREILASMNGGADLKGAGLNVAVNAVVGAIVRAGYLDSLGSAILISVEDNDAQRGARLQAELVAEVDSVLQTSSNAAGVLSQNFASDKSLDRQAQENSISAGKAALVNQVLAVNPNLDFSALSALSVEELRDLARIGAPAMPIGKDEAARIAKEASGIADPVIDVDPELDDIVAPHYEAELESGGTEYDFIIHAFTGEILNSYGGAPAPGEPSTVPNPPVSAEPSTVPNPPVSAEPSTAPSAPVSAEPSTAPSAPVSAEPSTAPSAPASTAPSTAPAADIGAEAAKTAALAHAGLTADGVTFEKVEKDFDGGRAKYEVEFRTADTEYDYEISAADGAVIKAESEPLRGAAVPSAPSAVPAASAAPAGDIGEEAAKAAALRKAGIADASSVTWSKCQREYDDGRLEYDIEFEADACVYDCCILAEDGSVLSFESEPCDNALHHHNEEHHDEDHHGGAQTSDIGADAATAAALSHAGLSASDVTGLRCERDFDDGRVEYEVEFRAGGYEYEYKIDAATGAVLEHERDRD